MKKIILLGALCIAMSVSAQAKSSDAIVDIDVHASTLGYGAGIAIPLSENFAARLSLSKANFTFNTTSDQIKYDATLKLESIAALADWHPFSGVTHLTAGVIFNNNGFDMNATPTGGSFTINGVTYNTSQISSLNAGIAFNKVAPYLGFGWSGRASKSGFSFKSDIGVMFQGSPKSTLAVSGSLANDPTVAANVAAEQAKLDKDMENFKLYPVISFGLAYAF
jgi:hypothetical protein